MDSMEKRWRSVDQAAEYLSVLVYTVRDATCKGELPYVRAGKRFIYDVRDLDAWEI
jgi:excisionase family DNA binding protein